MDNVRVFEALMDWNFWGNLKEEIYKREIIPSLPKPKIILVIKGVRRCGKSKISYLISKKFQEKESLIINFDDPRLKDIKAQDIIKIVELYQKNVNEKPKLIVFDEVQNINGWEKVAKLYAEAKQINVIVTGSSSKLMSEEYSTVLTGRHIDFELFPLSFREVLEWNKINYKTEIEKFKNKIKILKKLEEYIKFGSFPEVFLTEKIREKTILLREYFNDILIKDIVKRFSIREIEKIENLAMIYLSNISTLQSFNKLKNIVNLSLDSVERFSKYFEIAKLFIFIKKFGYSLKQQILSVKKVYCIDAGFFNALSFKFSENIGKLIENLVAIELLRRKSYWYNNWEIFYWKDLQQREVDFVIKEGLKIKQLIQVTYASDKDEIEKREIKALIKAFETFKKDKPELLVITWDYEDEEVFERKKIKFIPLWKWLLENKK